MENKQICPIHKIELAHRTGTSQNTGKPYDFYACPEKDKDGNFCKGGKQSPQEQIMNALRIMMAEIKATNDNVADVKDMVDSIAKDLSKRP